MGTHYLPSAAAGHRKLGLTGVVQRGYKEYRPVRVSTARSTRTKQPLGEPMAKLVEETTVAGRRISLVQEDIPLERVELDHDNPRIRYRLRLESSGKKLEELILGLSEVKALRRDIEKNGGLRERIFVQENGNGKFKVREGNCRTVCYRSLHARNRRDPRWNRIPARVLPTDLDERAVAILLSDFHVAGKIKWNAHEKAGQIYYMSEKLGMPLDDICVYLRSSKLTVSRFLHAYRFMADRFLKIDKGKYAKEGERKWSFFDELFKRAELREELKRDPEFADRFCRWVGEARLPQPVDVRKLPEVLKQQDARRKLENGGTFSEALKVLEVHEPEQVSDFFKLLQKVREACTNAVHIGEVIRTRTDVVAQAKMRDTYTALVGFMQLAGMEPPKV